MSFFYFISIYWIQRDGAVRSSGSSKKYLNGGGGGVADGERELGLRLAAD